MSDIWIAWIAFAIASAAPGPSTMAIMGTSLAYGRGAGMNFAAGVVTGSVTWGILSAFGTAALLTQVGWMLTSLKIAGGCYLLWMAYKSGRSALNAKPVAKADIPDKGFYKRGLALHITNPKAVFGWTATVLLGMPAGAPAYNIFIILVGCAVMAVIINCGYAFAFSTKRIVDAYKRARRGIDGVLASVFALAGLRLLTWRT